MWVRLCGASASLLPVGQTETNGPKQGEEPHPNTVIISSAVVFNPECNYDQPECAVQQRSEDRVAKSHNRVRHTNNQGLRSWGSLHPAQTRLVLWRV